MICFFEILLVIFNYEFIVIFILFLFGFWFLVLGLENEEKGIFCVLFLVLFFCNVKYVL